MNPTVIPRKRTSSRHAAALVGLGIFCSRIAGLVRQRVFAHYFGSSDAADAFTAAFRIPNLLQNLFGQGVLSASFIPVYAALLAKGDEREAKRTAGAILALLTLVTAVVVLLGVLATPFFIDLLAPGFHGAKRALTIRLVRILFPGAGLLVISAWCLGVLNSHRKFLLSYLAPVVWNGAMITTMLSFGSRYHEYSLATLLAWGSVAGSGLQVAVQWPSVHKLVRGMRLSLDHQIVHVREIIRNFVPVFVSRGVVQISAYVDGLLATLLPTGAVATFGYAQTLFLLPVALFGMSVSAAELPEMSGTLGAAPEVAAVLRRRLQAGLRQIAFFVVPSVVAFLALGDVVVAAVYQTGHFNRNNVYWVWGVLAGACVGLLASCLGRLYSSAYYALRDTRNPLKYAAVRVALATVLGIVAAFWLPGWLGLSRRWGVAGLTASAGIAAWVEYTLLVRGLRGRVGQTGVPRSFIAQTGAMAVAAAAAARALLLVIHWSRPWLTAIPVLGVYGLVYFGLAALWRVPELHALGRLMRRRG